MQSYRFERRRSDRLICLQSAVYYFDSANAYPIPHNGTPAHKTLERLQYWNVPSPVIEDELRRQKVQYRQLHTRRY